MKISTVNHSHFTFEDRSERVQWRKKALIATVWALFSVLFVTQVYPLVWLLLYSFKSDEEILDGSFFTLPHKMLWNNYHNAFVSGNYLMSLFNSIFVTGVTLILVVALGTMASYAITRFKWRYGGLFMAVFMIGIMIPHQSVLLPLLILFKNMAILNTYLALILPYIAFAIPMAVFILSGFLRSIPHEIEESAFIDGASVYRLFFSIILPIMKPPIMTIIILTFISVWNEYIKASILVSSSELKTLPFGVYSFISQFSTNYGSMGAFLVMSAAPVVLFYFFMAQRITQGMVAGAVKG